MTGRGVHLAPTGQHSTWVAKPDYWIDLLKRMGIDDVLICSAGDGGMGACQLMAENGIRPIIRFQPSNLPRPFSEMAHVETFVSICDRYGMEALVQAGNEPSDDREWKSGIVPPDWMRVFLGWWQNAARIIIERGGTAVFPDGPCYPTNPFNLMPDMWDDWGTGRCVYGGHFYGLNRPPDYPYDDVSRYGTPLTEAEHRVMLGPFYDVPGWREPLEAINAQRRAWANPDLTAIGDDTCWRGWEKVDYWAKQTFGQSVRIMLTEGGWTPGAIAGGGAKTDIRWPKPTPDTIAAYTLQALAADSPLETQTFWILASTLMGAGGWEDDCWVSGQFIPEGYKLEKPVVQALIDATEEGTVKIYDAEGTERDWAWLHGKYGSQVVVQSPQANEYWQVTEIHEVTDGSNTCVVTAPPATPVLWWWPDADAIPTQYNQEWHGNGDVDIADTSSYADFGMWSGSYYDPKVAGRGPHDVWCGSSGQHSEVLRGVGMLAGTNHYHPRPTFVWHDGGEEPPEPGDDFVDQLFAKLDRIIELLEGM